MTGQKKKVFALVIALALPSALSADNVRGPVIGDLTLESTSAPEVVTIGIEDLIGISIGGNGRFIKGVELDISIPPAARQYRDLLALYVYKQVSPVPSSRLDLYSGLRAGFVVLPTTARLYVNIPLKRNAIEPSAETTTLGSPITAAQFPLIVTVLPVAKGLPEGVSESKFPITVTPILENKGLLKLHLSENGKPPEFPYTLTIDGQQLAPDTLGYELSSGIHNMTVSSNHYKQVNKTFGIEKGQTTQMGVSLQPLVPTILFEAPDTAEIFLDGQKIGGVPKKPVPVTEGEHTVIIRVGNYSLTKKFSVERGRSYKVSLFLDISVQEN